MDQDDFGFVKQASIGTSKMDQGMESNDGQMMDQEWNQMFEMLERAELSDFVVNSSLKFNHALRSFGRSRSPPNLINQSETVRNHSTLCSQALKLNTKSFYPSSNHMKHVNENHSQSEKKVYKSGFEESLAQELGFGNNYSTSCSRPLKINTKSFYPSDNHMKLINEVTAK